MLTVQVFINAMGRKKMFVVEYEDFWRKFAFASAKRSVALKIY